MAWNDIPKLSTSGLLGHIRDYAADPIEVFRRFNRDCGDLGRIRLATIQPVVVNSPPLVEELLVRNAKHIRKSRLLRTALYPLAGEGLFTSEGELWRRQRKLMASLFQPNQLSVYAPSMTESALRCLSTWNDGDTVDFSREATRITMNVAGKTLFNVDMFDEADELGAALTIALGWAAKSAESPALLGQVELASLLDKLRLHGLANRLDAPWMWPTDRNLELQRAIGVIESRVSRMIDQRRSATGADAAGHSDLMTRLLRSPSGEDAAAISDRQVRDEVVTLFVAGHETTATALAWTLHLLSQHPQIAQRLREEIDSLAGEAPDAKDLPRLEYTQRVFKEALRLAPPVAFFEREALEEFELAGHRIPRGTYLIVFPWALHHREELWPDPERFDPDRFLPEHERARDRHAWIPFGAGPRVCIGNGFALMEGTLVLATLLQRAELQPTYQHELIPDPAAATFRPKGAVTMRVKLRATAAASSSANG